MSLAPPLRYPLLCSVPQRKGTKKVVQFAILVPFTTSDNGNGHNCVSYRTAQWKLITPPSGDLQTSYRGPRCCSPAGSSGDQTWPSDSDGWSDRSSTGTDSNWPPSLERWFPEDKRHSFSHTLFCLHLTCKLKGLIPETDFYCEAALKQFVL